LGESRSASRLRSGVAGTTGAECGVETWDLFVFGLRGDRHTSWLAQNVRFRSATLYIIDFE
jgi:hypothetical protein